MSTFVAHRTDGLSPYITVKDAAATLGLSEDGVAKWLRQGKLRGRKLGVRRWRVERASVEAALPAPAAETVEAAPTPLERTLSLLLELTADERRQVALAALSEGA